MTSKIGYANYLANLFPATRTKPEEIEEHGRQVLRDNLRYYEQSLRDRGGKVTVQSINEYNKKKHRIATVESNTAVLEESFQTAARVRETIDDIKKLQETQDIIARLQQTPDVSEVVFEQLEQLMDHPGFAPKLREYINRAADKDIQDTRKELNKLKDVVSSLNFPQKHREILQVRRDTAEAQARINKLETELQQTKSSYQELNTAYHTARIDLSTRASESTTEVSDLKTKIATLETKEDHAQQTSNKLQNDIQRLENEGKRKDKEILRVNTILADKDMTISNRDDDIRREQEKLDRLNEKYENLVQEHTQLQMQKAGDAGTKEMLDKNLEHARQAREEVQNDLEQSRTDHKQTKDELRTVRNKLEDLRIDSTNEIARLQEDNKRIEKEVQDHKHESDRRSGEIQRKTAELQNAMDLIDELRDETTNLLNEISNTKNDTTRELREEREAGKQAVARIRQQLDEANRDFKSDKAALDEANKDLRTEIVDLNSQIINLTRDGAQSQFKVALLQKEVEALNAEQQKLQGEVREAKRVNNGLCIREDDLKRNLARYESGQPILKNELKTLRQQITDRDADLSIERLKIQAAERRLQRWKEVIVRYAFGNIEGLVLDFDTVDEVLKSAPAIVNADIQRAIQVLSPLVAGLPEHPPLTGFQLWIEAVVRPDSFNSRMVLAYLKNCISRGIADIGFLLLTVDALLKCPDKTSRGFKLLATHDILQSWVILDSTRKDEVRSRFGKIAIARQFAKMHDHNFTLLDKFARCAEESMREVVDPPAEGITSRGIKFSDYIDRLEILQPKIVDISEPVDGTQAGKSMKLVSLESDPPYFLYINEGQVTWIKPKDITVRVDPINNIWNVHDKLQPHVIVEGQFSLKLEGAARMVTLLKDATYLAA